MDKKNLLFELSINEFHSIIDEIVDSKVQKVINLMNHESKEELEEFLTREQTCKLLNVSTTTLYHWDNNNILPAKRIKRRVYYSRVDVINRLNSIKNVA